MEQTTTVETKWGAYVIIWQVFLSLMLRISLSMMAKMMGIGKKHRSTKLIQMVFHKRRPK